jgi:hypothetical protein
MSAVVIATSAVIIYARLSRWLIHRLLPRDHQPRLFNHLLEVTVEDGSEIVGVDISVLPETSRVI